MNNHKQNLIRIELTKELEKIYNQNNNNSQENGNGENIVKYNLRNKRRLDYNENILKSSDDLKKKIKNKTIISESSSISDHGIFESISVPSYIKNPSLLSFIGLDNNLANLTMKKKECEKIINNAEKLKLKFEIQFENFEMNEKYEIICPKNSIPINSNILNFDFNYFSNFQKKLTGKLFSAVLIDPPWQISNSNPTRGVSISYDTLSDSKIFEIPINCLQEDGFIFIWTVNSKYSITLKMLQKWGYKYCDEIIWIKQTNKNKLAKGNGYYLQHSKESCVVGIKGNPIFIENICNDVIFSKRRGQSQKPDEIYSYIEKLLPNGFYLEIFGRRNNLRDNWVTIGNEL